MPATSRHCSAHTTQANNPTCLLLRDLRNVFEAEELLGAPVGSLAHEASNRVADILSRCTLEDLGGKYIHFDQHGYARVLIAVNKYFSLIVNCWNPDQTTPVHNHGGSVCAWVHVVKGVLTTKMSADHPGPTEVTIATGETKKLCDSMGDHETGNLSKSEQCVSLHLYSPPYLECTFSEDHGANCSCTEEEKRKYLPLIHCNDRHHYFQASEELETLALLKSRPVYGNFQKMVELLRKEIVIEPSGIHLPKNIEHIKAILGCFAFNPKEWRQYAHFATGRYTRNLIAYDEKFTVLLLCWEKGQLSPIHDHAGSNCWVKVLDGEIEESLYDLADDGITPTLRSRKVYAPGGIAYINDSYGVHKMGNAREDQVAISLHVYSPAYHECFIFGEEERMKKKVSISTAYGAHYPFMERSIAHVATPCADLAAAPTDMKKFLCHLQQVFTSVDADAEAINQLVNLISFSADQWDNYIHFSPDVYTRNLLGFTDHYSAVLACWCPGQETPIHEHGEEERRVWIKVLTGCLTIQFFQEKFNQLVPSTKAPVVLREGEYVMLHDNTLGQHRTFNASETDNCISLHIYSPPYVECSFVEKTGQQKLIPVAYCSKDISQYRAQMQEEDLELQCKFRSMVFSDLASFSNLINKAFDDSVEEKADKDFLEVRKMLQTIDFHPDEWRNRAVHCSTSPQYTRSLVAYGYNYSIHLIRWKPEQTNVAHDHSDSWGIFKVLEGKLSETAFQKAGPGAPVELATRDLTAGQVVTHLPGDIHRLANLDPHVVAYSLHVYSPPLKQCHGYDMSTGQISLYNCNHHLTPCADEVGQ